ncbi:MAG: DUF3500 domain-containing protein [Planctomycetaceae bacterium]|nr:DUF3500 domain-containing protein [Planctomycetaceae bacterium]MCA9065269.1 DUF3500 domain-containing protein [Planctomycetaceae bacterium]
MSASDLPRFCSDSAVDRRTFVRTVAGAAALAALPGQALMAGLFSGPPRTAPAETAVGEFYRSLSESQRTILCHPFDHELRSRINANWHITAPQIGEDFFSAAQREMIARIVRGVTSEDGYERLTKQMDEDAGGLDYFSVAMFGNPEDGPFEFELTGRHLTLRADGDSVDQAAFGGPLVYGHGEEDPAQNLYFYQTEQANQVFTALNSDQAAKALLKKAPAEAAVKLQGSGGTFPGVRVGDLDAAQKELVEKTLKVLMAPYREADVKEAFGIIKQTGGLDALHMAFYEQGDLNSDRKWDIWRVEGPSMVWHFRGAPHVHAYINIGVVKG